MRFRRPAVCALFGAFLLSAPVNASTADGLNNRWFSLDNAMLGIRSAYEQGSNGETTTNQMQYRDGFDGQFFFDPSQKYSLGFGVGAGDAFPGGWGNTGVGNAPASPNSYLKLLYLDAKPISNLEMQWGGIGIERGLSSAITSYSNDGFMAGERFLVRNSHVFYFDKVAVTFGYLGDTAHPNVWNRAQTLWMNNYQQYLVQKAFSQRFSASADYTVLGGARTMREAATLNVREMRFVDELHLDLYERANRTAATGGSVSASKALSRRFSLTGGYAAIDRAYGDLNDDAFFHGRRMYVAGTLHLVRGLSVSPMFDHGVGNSYDLPNNLHFHLALTYDLLDQLRERAN